MPNSRLRGRVFSIPPEPDPFRENLTARTLATDGYRQHALNYCNVGPTAGGNRAYLAYMTDGGALHGTHDIKIACVWDYTTGTSDSFTVVDSVTPSSSDAHEPPHIHRLTDGTIIILYGGISAFDATGASPFYRTSTAPDNVTAFSARSSVAGNLLLTENSGGLDSNGTLHVMGAGANQNLSYLSYVPGTSTWTATQAFIADGGGTVGIPPGGNGYQGDPVGSFRTYVVPGTTTIYHSWSGDIQAGAGDTKHIYIIKSTDGGTTWTDMSGGNSFTRTGKLLATFDSSQNIYEFNAAYKVHSGTCRNGLGMTVLSNGRPVITYRDSGGLKVKLYAGSGTGTSVWSSVTITDLSVDNIGTMGCNLICTSADKLMTWASPATDGAGNVVEYASTDGGSSWSPTTIWTKSSETFNKHMHARVFTNLGGKERALVCWVQTFSGTNNNVMFMDRPQS